MIKYKEGVNKDGMSDKIKGAINVADKLYKDETGKDITVTSVNDGRHMLGSFHYTGNAVDFRTRNITPEQAEKITVKLQNSLGPDHDVINEKKKKHIHVEYDPKKK